MSAEHGTKTLIKETALRLFAQKGVAETSVRDLARAAGIAEGTLYRHYAAKEDMVRDLFREHYAAFAGRIDALQQGQANLADKLKVVVADACRLFDENPDLYRFLLLSQHEVLPHLPRGGAGDPMAVLRRMIAAGIKSGEVKVADPALGAAMVMGLVLQPALAIIHGSLKGPLSPHAGAIAAACERVLSS
jgi:AcrR family transcriptional regulator